MAGYANAAAAAAAAAATTKAATSCPMAYRGSKTSTTSTKKQILSQVQMDLRQLRHQMVQMDLRQLCHQQMAQMDLHHLAQLHQLVQLDQVTHG